MKVAEGWLSSTSNARGFLTMPDVLLLLLPAAGVVDRTGPAVVGVEAADGNDCEPTEDAAMLPPPEGTLVGDAIGLF